MDLTVSSVADFDRLLLDEYDRFVGLFPEQPVSFIQRRFAQYGLFPKLGWALLGVGEAEALSHESPAVLYGTLSRFIKCAHGCWGPTDEQGLHWGGYDFSSLVVPSLYSALLGKDYIASIFHGKRSMSTKGYGAYKHAANLMICLDCQTWPFKEKVIASARTFVSSNSKSKTDRAFVGFFIGVLTCDRTVIAETLSTISDGYLNSDWGRNKPLTKFMFLQAMIAYAQFYLVDPVDPETHRSLVSSDRMALWREFAHHLSAFQRTPHQFLGPLSFLNDVTFR